MRAARRHRRAGKHRARSQCKVKALPTGPDAAIASVHHQAAAVGRWRTCDRQRRSWCGWPEMRDADAALGSAAYLPDRLGVHRDRLLGDITAQRHAALADRAVGGTTAVATRPARAAGAVSRATRLGRRSPGLGAASSRPRVDIHASAVRAMARPTVLCVQAQPPGGAGTPRSFRGRASAAWPAFSRAHATRALAQKPTPTLQRRCAIHAPTLG